MNNQQIALVMLMSITEPKVAKDNRSYYTAEFRDPSNPFAKTVKRNFWQQLNAAGESEWRGANPKDVKPFLGKNIPGYIATRAVEPYSIPRADKEDYEASTYTTVILGHEMPEVVFKSLGHPLASAVEEAIDDTVVAEPEIA